jgi:hypothetical protein
MGTLRRLDAQPSRAVAAEATKALREIFASLAKRDRLSSEELEVLFERVDASLRTLPKRSWMFDALDRVVGKSKRRRRDSIFVLVALAAVPGAEARMLPLLRDSSVETRREAIQAVIGQRWGSLAPSVAERLRVEEDVSCRNALIFACGELRTEETLEALLAAATLDLETPIGERHRLLFHLRKHRSERARAYFEGIFAEPLPDAAAAADGSMELKVLAAWGLAKLGRSEAAHAFLVKMLDDTRVVHVRDGQVTGVEPGLSERAGQALADVHGLAFRWGRGDVRKVRAHLRRLERTRR